MSHFLTLVLLNGAADDRETLKRQVAKALDPYNENNEAARAPKWDWWQIGGRWTGALTGYDPDDDPANTEVCKLCNGTGKRTDAHGLAARAVDPAYTCNGCSGKGISVKWPTQWANYSGDVQRVCDIKPDFVPFALVTPDGVWHEKGKMKMFGMSDDNYSDSGWKLAVQRILASHPDATAVVVDCHV